MTRSHQNTVAVTGIGLVSALGRNATENWAALSAGQSGASLIQRFPVDGLRTQFAACVDRFCDVTRRPTEITHDLAQMAMQEALAQSGHADLPQFPGKLVVAVPPVQMEWPDRLDLANTQPTPVRDATDLIHAAGGPAFRDLRAHLRFGETTERLAREIRPEGLPATINTACSSGASAIQIGVEAIRRGEVDAALVIGADASVSPEMLLRFGLLSALSRRNDDPATASRPFDATRDGFVPGEGAGALVLERHDIAEKRGAPILGLISGIGERLDAYHRIRQRPDAGPVAAAMAAAIADAALRPDDIDYVNAHGTSTGENDRVECKGLYTVLGARAAHVPVSSIKSMTGHTLSAAGAIEAAATIMMLQHQQILPTINLTTLDPDIALDVVPNVARASKITHVLSNSFGFGGQNVCLVISKAP